MATDYIKAKDMIDTRFADAAGNYLGICDANITRTISSEFIVVLLAECNAHNGCNENIELEWENTTDAVGVWNKLQAGAGELRQGTGTVRVSPPARSRPRPGLGWQRSAPAGRHARPTRTGPRRIQPGSGPDR